MSQSKVKEGNASRINRVSFIVGIVVVVLIVAIPFGLNAYADSLDTGTRKVFAKIEVDRSLERFLDDFAYINDMYEIDAYGSPQHSDSLSYGGKLIANELSDLQKLIADGGIDSSTYSGLLVLVRGWWSQNLAIRLYFEKGVLVDKELGPRLPQY